MDSLHDAGISVGVTVLLGAGGERYADGHTSRTAEDCAPERQTILNLLKINDKAAAARTATYDIREFVY